MVHLRSIQKKEIREADVFPFNVPVIRALNEIEFHAPVTFFVGENGSGKSTLMEAIACAIGSVTVGSQSVNTDPHPLAELVSRTSELFPLNDNAAEFVPSDTHGSRVRM